MNFILDLNALVIDVPCQPVLIFLSIVFKLIIFVVTSFNISFSVLELVLAVELTGRHRGLLEHLLLVLVCLELLRVFAAANRRRGPRCDE